MKVILGDGLLGTELAKRSNWNIVSRKKNGIEFTQVSTYKKLIEKYDTIINCIGYVETYNTDRKNHWNINYEGVADLVDLCNVYNKKLVHISTDFIYANSKSYTSENDIPVHGENWYSYTKLLADGYIQLRSKEFLIIRGSFKKYPFPYDRAWKNQAGNFDYVPVFADLAYDLIEGSAVGIYNVGTEEKTMYNLARQSNFNIEKIENFPTTPTDVTMDLTKLNKFLRPWKK